MSAYGGLGQFMTSQDQEPLTLASNILEAVAGRRLPCKRTSALEEIGRTAVMKLLYKER